MRDLPGMVWHLTDAKNRESIARDGLLSASRLLDRAGMSGAERARVESGHRAACVRLADGTWLRDQKPMPPGVLARALVDGSTPASWYRHMNAHVFCFLDRARAVGHVAAYRDRRQIWVAIDTARLREADVAVTPINTGNARRRAAPRGLASFVPLAQWRESGWASEAAALGTRPRAASHPPAELVVVGRVRFEAVVGWEAVELPD